MVNDVVNGVISGVVSGVVNGVVSILKDTVKVYRMCYNIFGGGTRYY